MTAQLTTVVHVKHEVFDIFIGREGFGYKAVGLGNPFKSGSREQNIANYRAYFFKRLSIDKPFKELVLSLKGKRLGCFCHGSASKTPACHGDVLVEFLNTHPE